MTFGKAVAAVGGAGLYLGIGVLVGAWTVSRAAAGKPYWTASGPEPVQLATVVALWPLTIVKNLTAKA